MSEETVTAAVTVQLSALKHFKCLANTFTVHAGKGADESRLSRRYKSPHQRMKLTPILAGNFSISNANYAFLFTFKFRTTCFEKDILDGRDGFNHNFN